MAEGEELPPVVATLVGDDADFLAMLERDIEAARSTAGEIQAALAEGFSGITVSGAQISGQGIGAAGEVIGEQLATGIEQGAAGLDLRPEMEGAVSGASEVGQAAGDEITAGIADAAATGAEGAGAALAGAIRDGAVTGAGEAESAIGAAFTTPVIQQFDQTGVQAGAAFASGFAVSADIGEAVRVALTGATIGNILGGSLGGASAMGALTSSLVDAAAEAGGAAGVELSRNLSEAAVAALSDEQFAEFTDMLIATASTAGTEAGAAAAESLGASLNTSLIGVDLIGQGLSTVGKAMSAGAQAAAQGAADAMASVEESTLSGSQAYEAELDAVFEAIWQGGQGMTVRLAAAMTEAFQGIEADTAGFSEAELMIFREFYDTLNQMGDQAAQSFAERMRLVQQEAVSGADIMASGMSTIGLPMPGAPGAPGGQVGIGGGPPVYGIGIQEPVRAPQPEPTGGITVPGLGFSELKTAGAAASEVGGELAGVASAADGAGVAVGGLASTMGGPLMMALFGAATVLPMLGNMFQSNNQQAQATAQAWQQVTQAIAQDSDMVGSNTVAAIQNELITSGAADTLKGYGISLTDATSAMAGVKSAQTDVTGSLNSQIDALQSLIQEQSAHTQGASTEIESERQQVEQLQATRDAMQQLEADVVGAVQHQNDLTQATLQAEQAADVYNVQVRAGVLALEQQAQSAKVSADALGAYDMTLVPSSQAYKDAVNNQAIALANSATQAGINAQALNQSLGPQAQLSGEAIQAALAYQQASTATGAYTSALNGLYGQYGQTTGAEAAATTAVANLSGQITSGKDAVDGLTSAGAKNLTLFQGAAQAAETYAEKLYNQTGDADQATQALQDFATKIDHAAAEAHLTKGQIDELNTALFGVPDVKDITVHLDPTPAEQQMSALDSFIQGEIADINNTAITPVVGGRPGQPRAAGGPVTAGELYVVGERGIPEFFVPGADGYITPMDMLTPAMTAPGSGPNNGGFGYTSAPPTVHLNVYVDGRLATSGVRVETQNFERRNGFTGLVANGR